MGELANTVGFVVIVLIYASVGVFTVLGSAFVSQRMFAPRHEQVFYGLFLIAIAAFYLAFVAYFGAESAWRTEMNAVIVFAVLGLLGTRLPAALLIGYPLHALWDLLHEWHTHAAPVLLAPEELTAIPLGYGVFCLVFDFGIAVYFVTRMAEWSDDRQARGQTRSVPTSD